MKVDKHKLRHLLEKYYQGQTSIEEEEALRYYFTHEEFSIDFEADSRLFGFTHQSFPGEDQEELSNSLKHAIQKVKNAKEARNKIVIKRLTWISTIAASVVLIIGIGWFYTQQNRSVMFTETFDDPAKAYQQTKDILMMISRNMNKGLADLESLSEISNTAEKLKPLSELPKQIERVSTIQIIDNPTQVIRNN